MRGIDRDGRPVDMTRSEAPRPAPPGRLARGALVDLRRLLTRSLRRTGYTVEQITQVVRTSCRTAARDLIDQANDDDDRPTHQDPHRGEHP